MNNVIGWHDGSAIVGGAYFLALLLLWLGFGVFMGVKTRGIFRWVWLLAWFVAIPYGFTGGL